MVTDFKKQDFEEAHVRLFKRHGKDDFSYCDAAVKRSLHNKLRGYLRALLAVLDCEKDNPEIRANAGGIAVSGEVTLHTERLYCQMSQHAGRRGISILIRSCKNRQDYSGGRNNIVHLQEANWGEVIDTCRRETRKDLE